MYQIPSVIIGILIIVAGYQASYRKNQKASTPDEKADCKKDVSEHIGSHIVLINSLLITATPQMNNKISTCLNSVFNNTARSECG